MGRFKEPVTWIETLIAILIPVLGFTFWIGRTAQKVDAHEDSLQELKEFKDGTVKEVSAMHAEVDLLLDHFRIPHDGGE